MFVRQCSLGGRLFRWSVISRRSNRRAGTRWKQKFISQELASISHLKNKGSSFAAWMTAAAAQTLLRPSRWWRRQRRRRRSSKRGEFKIDTTNNFPHLNIFLSRGSIPLFWTQTPTVREYKPDPRVEPSKRHLESFAKHFAEQTAIYGEQVRS